MKKKSGKEIRSLVLAVSLTTLLLVLAVIAYFMVTIIVTANNNIEHNKEKMIEESASSLTGINENINSLIKDPSVLGLFNQEKIEKIVIEQDWDVLYDMVSFIALGFYPIEYVGVIRDGELVSFDARSSLDIDPADMPTQPPTGDYETLDSLGGEEGFFVSAFFPAELGILGIEETIYINMILDRTAELADIEDYFESQRNDLILRLSIASVIAIILTLLLTTIGLRYFTRKYVVDPIEELNRTAEAIADGTFEGEVAVDKESAYAALQGLLQSGQKVLSRMDEELDK
jgi:hypothetical protein